MPTPSPTVMPTPIPTAKPTEPPTPEVPPGDYFEWDTNCVVGTETYDYCGVLEFCSPSAGSYGYRQLNPDGICSSPGPTIRINSGKRYLLTLVNNVPETVTNLHTHGLHISGAGNADDVTRFVEYNHMLHYVWDLSKFDQMGGTFWYHAHHHTATYDHVNHGAVGFLIVNDDFDTLLPSSLGNKDQVKRFLLNEKRIFIHYVAINSLFGDWYANGERNPQIEVVDGEWTRLRIAMSHAKASRLDVAIEGESGGENPCEVREIAHDGVYINDVPSSQTDVSTITSASRLDLAVRCTSPGAIAELTISRFHVVATINVVAGQAIDASPFDDQEQTWSPNRPYALRDLRGETVPDSNKFSVELTAEAVNGKRWDAEIPLGLLDYDTVQEWILMDTSPHPFHMHLYHMQVVTPGGCGPHIEGEWYDTISSPGDCTIRFKTADIGERMVMHCHIIEHSDNGSMGWMNVTGGPTEPDQNPGIGQEPIDSLRKRTRKLRGKERYFRYW